MAVQSSRQSIIVFTGDVTGTEIAQAAVNQLSPGASQVIALVTGPNTITVPAVALVYVPTAVTIQPDPLNTSVLALKGVSADTGIPIHPTDQMTLSLASTTTSFVILVASGPVNIRFTWS